MGFLQKHAEKVLFAGLLVGLVLSLLLVLQINLPSPGTAGLRPPSSTLPKTIAGIDSLLAAISVKPPSLAVVTNAFTSTARKQCRNVDDQSLIPLDAKVCPFCGQEQQDDIDVDNDKDGIPDRVEREWGMNPNDPSDALVDQDGDGFPALYEYQKGTSAIDATDHPPLIDYVRLDNVVEKRMSLELLGSARLSDTVYTLQLRWQYPDETQWGKPEFIRTGTYFGRNKEFLAEKFTEKRVLKDTKYVDESFATIRSGRHELNLRRDGEGRQGSIIESTATLKLIFGPAWSQDIRMGQTFELHKISYKVIDIRRDAVVIQSGTSEPITVIAPTAEELEALKPPVAAPAPGGTPEDLGFDPALLQQIMNQGR